MSRKLNTAKYIPEKNQYIAASADVIGDIRFGSDVSVWYHAVIRADADSVTVGDRTNIQDGCILHTDPGFPIVLGSDVTVGHGAILHGCTVKDASLIGMGAIILDGAVIGKNCIVGAGALVTGGTIIPDGSMVMGSPAKVKRALRPEELSVFRENASEYVESARMHFSDISKETLY